MESSSSGQDTFSKFKFNIVLVGDACSGKTSVARRFVNKEFKLEQNNKGLEFFLGTVSKWGKQIKLHITDTPGNERFKSFIPQSLKNAQAIFLIYDTTIQFDSINYWENLIDQHAKINTVIYIIGNKIDLQSKPDIKQINERQIQNVKQSFGPRANVREVSAKTGLNIEEIFIEACKKIFEVKHPNVYKTICQMDEEKVPKNVAVELQQRKEPQKVPQKVENKPVEPQERKVVIEEEKVNLQSPVVKQSQLSSKREQNTSNQIFQEQFLYSEAVSLEHNERQTIKLNQSNKQQSRCCWLN